jgi:L,D-transpeptidase ErfK/SrfK
MIPVGTPGEFVYQPVKVGARNGHVYVEVHKDIYDQIPGPYREAVRLIHKLGWANRVDLNRVQRAVVERSGVPMDVTRLQGLDDIQDEVVRPPSAPRQANAQPAAPPLRQR